MNKADYEQLAARCDARGERIAALEARVADAEALGRAYAKLEARCRELESALAFWMPDEGLVDPAYQATWDKHIELLPPAADRIGAALDRGLTAETKGEQT